MHDAHLGGRRSGRPTWWWPVVLSTALAAVLVLDLLTHLGYAAGVLYAPVVVLSTQTGSRRDVVVVSVASLVLILVGSGLSPDSPLLVDASVFVANRALSALAVATSAFLAVVTMAERERLDAARRQLERQRSELVEQHDLLTLAGEIGHFGGWSYDVGDTVVRWSDEVARIHRAQPGFSPQLAEGIGFYADEDRPRITAAFEACLTTGEPFDQELRLDRVDGARIWVNSTGRAVHDHAGEVVGVRGSFQDITARKLAEEEAARRAAELRAAEQQADELARRLAETVESVGDAVVDLDRQWRITAVNGNAERLVGRTRANLVGRPVWDEFPEEVGEVFHSALGRAVEEDAPTRVDAYSVALQRWLEVSAHPHAHGLSVYFRDVTEQRRLAEQVAQLQRLDSLGQLTGGVAHDFNNLLTVILGSSEILRHRLTDPALLQLASSISSTAHRGADLTRSLLAFARRQPLDPVPVDVNDVVRSTTAMLSRILPEQVVVATRLADGLPPALADRGQLENAVLNLCINARDAMPEGGPLLLETRVTELDAGGIPGRPDLVDGTYLALAVSDDGEGIEPGDLQHVFEPFFTTKDAGAGSGLGLAMVYGFVTQSGGHVDIESTPGAGTTVTLLLPAVTA